VKLSQQAKKILREIKKFEEITVRELEDKGYDQSMVNRSTLELKEKGLVETTEEEEVEQQLTEKGQKIIQKGSPEYNLLQKIDNKQKISEIDYEELEIALGKAREKDFIEIRDGEVLLTDKGLEKQDSDEVKEKLKEKEFEDEHRERGLVEAQIKPIRTIKITEKGLEVTIKEIETLFDVEANVKTPRTGRKHFYRQIIDFAREKWLEMGFEEMQANYISPGLYNFDALYIPQDHPARELQDTFFMEKPEKTEIPQDLTKRIKETHENGWTTGSKGWQYNWEEEEAARNVLRTHTTSVSAETLAKLEEEDLPKKFFTVSRAFRNETIDRTHLAEFYQADGIVVGKDLNFANLKAYISEFFEKMGYDEFRLIPSYYPYTEMSVEVQVWDEEEQEWLGMGGAGMFRPEVTKPLLGFEATVLAWGLGIGRIAMKAAELHDIRELYRNDIKILENTPVWRPKNQR